METGLHEIKEVRSKIYKPYTLRDYQKVKDDAAKKRGGLGANIGNE